MKRSLILGFLSVLLASNGSLLAGQSDDEAAIRKTVEDYVTAYNAHDAKTLAARWSEHAVYQNPLTGDEVSGREAIQEQFANLFKDSSDAKLEVEVLSIEFVSPSVAIERGVATVIDNNTGPEQAEYSAVHVKQDDQWLLDRITEKVSVEAPSHYEKLKTLEWLVGTWIDEDENARVETTCQWAKNQNYLTRSFTIDIADEPLLSGIQFIGWDGAAGKIRSWAFDSDGGFTEGSWSNKDDRWIVESSAVLPDGRRSSSINVIKVVDDDTMTWQVTGRDVDGEILPNLPEVKVARTHPAD